MAQVSELFKQLAKVYSQKHISYPQLKAVTLAQWALESGWGTSDLATAHFNFGGLKWRPEMKKFAEKVRYEAHDGWDDYCKFASLEKFIEGYWGFLDRAPYEGWKEHSGAAEDFIGFISPIYCPGREGYVEDVLEMLPKAEKLLKGQV
jgi:flagellum-specific peptidoglycan hydrolase FlgJ